MFSNGEMITKYWSILWRYGICLFIVGAFFETIIVSGHWRFIKLNQSILFVCHALFFICASIFRNNKFSQWIWRNIFTEDELKIIYRTFISTGFILAILNFIIAENFSTEIWVYFKIFGISLYVLGTPVLSVHLLRKENKNI